MGNLRKVIPLLVLNVACGALFYIIASYLRESPPASSLRVEVQKPALSILSNAERNIIPTGYDHRASRMFSKSETGQLLASYTNLLRSFENNNAEDLKLLERQNNFIKSHPKEVFEEIQKIIKYGDENLSVDREYLIKSVTNLNISLEEKVTFYEQTIQAGQDKFDLGNLKTYGPVYAFTGLVGSSNNPRETERVVNDQLALIQNAQLKDFLRGLYNAEKPTNPMNR